MEIGIKVEGVDAFARQLRDLGINRIPNYVARSLTALAERVQDGMIAETQRELTVRGTWLRKGTRFGVNRKPASKDRLVATVSTAAPWLVSEEVEDTRRSHTGRRILIPLPAVRTGRQDAGKIPSKFNAAARRSRLSLVRIKSDRSGEEILYERVHGKSGRGRNRKTMSMLVPLFLLQESAPIPRRVRLLENGEKAVNAMYPAVVGAMLQRAIEESRVP